MAAHKYNGLHPLATSLASRFLAWRIPPIVDRSLFPEVAKAMLGRCYISPPNVENMPKKGKTIVIANHPTPLDGLLAVSLFAGIRQDVLIVAGKTISPLAQSMGLSIEKNIIYVQPNDQNLAAMRRAITHVQKGGALIIFPAGAAPRLPFWYSQKPQERPWKPFVGRLAQMDGVTTIPVHINADMHPLLHKAWKLKLVNIMAALPLEAIRMLACNNPIPASSLADLATPQDVANHLREATLALKPPAYKKPRRLFSLFGAEPQGPSAI